MTVSNPHPLANPLNSRVVGNGYSAWTGAAFSRGGKPDVPIPNPYNQRDPESLRIPSGNPVPIGSEHLMALDPRHNRDLLRLSDGTIISKSTGRVVRNGIEEGSSTGCWGNRKIGNPFGDQGASWNDLDRLPLNMDPNERKMVEVGLSPEDIEYARMREAGSRSLVANMSDEQVKLLKKLENGEITRLSRLVPD